MKYACLALLLSLGAGCGDLDANPRWLIEEPRLLAVRAEPPVVGLDGRATLDALVLDADGRRAAVDVSFRACNPWRFVRDPLIDCAPADALTLDGQLDVRAVLARFPPPDGTASAPLGAVPVVAEVRIGARRLVTVKDITVRAEESTARNPEISALLLDGVANPVGFEAARAYELSASVLAYEPGNARVFLYATSGEIDEPRLDVLVDDDGAEQVVSIDVTTWTAPSDGVVRFWLVAVDDQGGVSWWNHELVGGSP